MAEGQTPLDYLKARIDAPNGKDSADGLSLEDALQDSQFFNPAFSSADRVTVLRYTYEQFVSVYETYEKLIPPTKISEHSAGEARTKMEQWRAAIEGGWDKVTEVTDE